MLSGRRCSTPVVQIPERKSRSPAPPCYFINPGNSDCQCALPRVLRAVVDGVVPDVSAFAAVCACSVRAALDAATSGAARSRTGSSLESSGRAVRSAPRIPPPSSPDIGEVIESAPLPLLLASAKPDSGRGMEVAARADPKSPSPAHAMTAIARRVSMIFPEVRTDFRCWAGANGRTIPPSSPVNRRNRAVSVPSPPAASTLARMRLIGQ